MTDSHSADERLRQAFRALRETSTAECSDEDLERVWKAVTGELSVDERHEMVSRLADEPALAEAWRLAHELSTSIPHARPAALPRRLPAPAWMAAAAVLVVGVAAALLFLGRGLPRDETFRNSDHYRVESRVAPDATLPREAFRLRWTPGPENSRYRVRVTTEDLRVVLTAEDLTVPEVVVDPQRLAQLAPGTRLLWQVDAVFPGGSTSSPTFVIRVN